MNKEIDKETFLIGIFGTKLMFLTREEILDCLIEKQLICLDKYYRESLQDTICFMKRTKQNGYQIFHKI